MPLKYKIGADPEFSILYDGRRVSADATISSLFKGDPKLTGHTLKTEGGEFGCDGCSSTGELRPKPALEPAEVTSNIRKCFEHFFKRGNELELSTLSLWAPVGGHIHLELPDTGRSITDQKAAEVHKKLMSFYLPIIMGEQKTNLAIRMKSYGKLTDFRIGEHPTMEVRAPSAEWLTSEHICRSTLAYMTMLWHEVWEHPENLDKGILLRTQKQEDALQELAVSEFNTLTKGLMRAIAKNVKKFELYPKFKEEVDFILRPDRVLAEKKKHNFTINSGWGFAARKVESNKRKFLAKQKMVDLKAMSLGIAHNGDMNTASLAEEISNRILNGFKLKNNYFIYGLKKDVEGFLVSKEHDIYLAPKAATEDDAIRLRETANRMWRNGCSVIGVSDKVKIDFKTSKIVRESKPIIAIGVPYAEREKKSFKKTLELVWDLEKKDMKPMSFEAMVCPKDVGVAALPETVTPVDTEDAFTPDNHSQGADFARSAVREIMETQAREERSLATAANTNELILRPLDESQKLANLQYIIARSTSCYANAAAGEEPQWRLVLAVQPSNNRVLTLNPERGYGWDNRDRNLDWLPAGLRGLYWVTPDHPDARIAPQRGAGLNMPYRIGELELTHPLRMPGGSCSIPILDNQNHLTGGWLHYSGEAILENVLTEAAEVLDGDADGDEPI